MRSPKTPLVVLMSTAVAALCATSTVAAQEHHRLSQSAVEIARPFGFPVTNSMVVTWVVAIGLIVFAQLATRHMKEVPEGSQNFLEWLVESLYGFLEGLLGAAPGETDLLVLRQRVHLHPCRQLGRPDSRCRLDRMGTPDGRGLPDRGTVVPRRQRRRQPDAGDGADVLRHAGSCGAFAPSARWVFSRRCLHRRDRRRAH